MDQVILYLSANYQGLAAPVGPGLFSNLTVGSIKIPAGFLVSLTDAAGQTRLYSGDQPSLGGSYASAVITQLDSAITLPSAALDKLRTFVEKGLTFDFFTAAKTSTFKLDAGLKVQVDATTVTLSGVVTLGAPFSASFMVTITLSLTDRSFKVALQILNLADLFSRGMVGMSATVQARVNDVVMPYVQVLQGARFELNASASGDVSVDLYASLPLIKLPPLSLINQQFPHFQLSTYVRPLDLHIGCSAGSVPAFTVDASVNLDLQLGTPALCLKGIKVAATADTKNANAALSMNLIIRTKNASLEFTTTASVEATGAVKLTGTLASMNGGWKNPLGIPFVTLNQVTAGLGATAEAPWVAVVLFADGVLQIGATTIDAAVGVNFDPANWQSAALIVDCRSDINLGQLLGTMLGGAFPVDKVIDVKLQKPKVILAPTGFTTDAATYPAGYQVSGKVSLWGWNASVDGLLDPTSGGHLYGTMDPINLSLGGTPLLSITAAGTTAGPRLMLDCSTSSFGATVLGAMRIFDMTGGLSASLSKSGFSMTFMSSATDSIYSGAKVTFDSTGFTMALSTHFGFGINIPGTKGIDLSQDVRIKLAARVGGDLTQSITFTSSALGETLTLGPISWSIPVHAVSDVVQLFKDQCEKKCGDWVKQKLQALTDAAYAWIKANVGSSPETLAYLLKWAGLELTQIASALVKYTGLSVFAAAKLVQDLF